MRLSDILEALSSLARTGWMLRGVPYTLGETVSSHSFSAALIALEVSLRLRERGLRVDPYKAAAIALVHDVGEAIVGDISKAAGIEEAKREAELEAFTRLDLSEGIKDLYREFQEGTSAEALLASLGDQLATYLKALSYRERGYKVDDILASTRENILEISGKLGVREFIEKTFLGRNMD